MREVVVISGKGGTGKTSLTGALAGAAENMIICDLDVDAPDLHILLEPDMHEVHEFYSGNEAVINSEKCVRCGLCVEMCKYGAVSETEEGFQVNPLRCEGCKVCVAFCPEEAVDFPERHCGRWYISNTRFGTMVHAGLFPGAENSGRLVTLLREQARQKAGEQGKELILCDGAPGIGCPVISSLSNTDLAVIVTEPTLSGLHDLTRVSDLCAYFKIQTAVIINKSDLNSEQAEIIQGFCLDRGIELAGTLPYDPEVTLAMSRKQAITEVEGSHTADQIRKIRDRIQEML
ncbi:MAG: ATP-binding protein [Desulfonatronovibrionaceae bacterium]